MLTLPSSLQLHLHLTVFPYALLHWIVSEKSRTDLLDSFDRHGFTVLFACGL